MGILIVVDVLGVYVVGKWNIVSYCSGLSKLIYTSLSLSRRCNFIYRSICDLDCFNFSRQAC